MKEKSIVGDLINFRGLVYSPVNEDGVVFIFGKVIEDLNMYIEEIKTGFPDCTGRRFTGRGWERVFIEFEYQSSNFKDHGHDPSNCDIIVCWEHDWPECPLEVIELKEIIKTLPSKSVQHPDVKQKEYYVEDLWRTTKVIDSVKNLFQRLDKDIKGINDEIWAKVTKSTVTYYSPERVFLYTWFRQRGISFDLFTGGQKVEGVHNYDQAKGGAKWGWIRMKDEEDLPKVFKAVEVSYQLIKQAIKNNETTGWYAKVEEAESVDLPLA